MIRNDSWPRATRRARTLIAATAALLIASGCGRLPTETAVDRAGAARSFSVTGTDRSTSAIAELLLLSESDSVAIEHDSQIVDVIPELSLALLRTPPGQTTSAFVHELKRDGRVRDSEADAILETAEGSQSTVAFSEGLRAWDDVEDQSALARIGAAEARQVGQGAGVIVAILDTGIDLDHPALAGVIELPGIERGEHTDPGDDRPEEVDTNEDGIVDGALGHGTHVAGLVHAVAPEARLLAVRVLDSDGVGSSFEVARGIVAAVARGARVINLSLGMLVPCRAIEAAVNHARERGVVVVAAAGNRAVTTLDYPAAYPHVLAVAGTDADDRKAEFSDFGYGVDVAAPAVGILSTYWDGTYARWSGTSMAAPFVAGTAALLYGALGERSTLAAGQIENVIPYGATPLGEVDPVYGALLGAGRLNAAESAARLLNLGPPVEETLERGP